MILGGVVQNVQPDGAALASAELSSEAATAAEQLEKDAPAKVLAPGHSALVDVGKVPVHFARGGSQGGGQPARLSIHFTSP